MKMKLLIPIIAVLALVTTAIAGDFKIQNSTFDDLFIVTGIDGNATFIGGITIAADGLDEVGINFATVCPSGSRLYVSSGNLACEVAGNTTEEITDLVGTMVTGNTETDITVTFEDGDDTFDFVVNPTFWNESDDLDDIEINESKIAFVTVCGAGNHLYIDSNKLVCEADADTTYTAEAGMNLTGTVFSLRLGCAADDVLKWDGDASWNCTADIEGAGLANVVEDTTPQLGGSLDLNDFAIDNGAGTTNMTIDDSDNFIIVLA